MDPGIASGQSGGLVRTHDVHVDLRQVRPYQGQHLVEEPGDRIPVRRMVPTAHEDQARPVPERRPIGTGGMDGSDHCGAGPGLIGLDPEPVGLRDHHGHVALADQEPLLLGDPRLGLFVEVRHTQRPCPLHAYGVEVHRVVEDREVGVLFSKGRQPPHALVRTREQHGVERAGAFLDEAADLEGAGHDLDAELSKPVRVRLEGSQVPRYERDLPVQLHQEFQDPEHPQGTCVPVPLRHLEVGHQQAPGVHPQGGIDDQVRVVRTMADQFLGPLLREPGLVRHLMGLES